MSEEIIADDSSHYEVSLTGGQAFVAFVLLLFSLSAAFAFGLMVGKGQVDERLVVKREPSVINEGIAEKQARASEARIVELGAASDRAASPDAAAETEITAPTIVEDAATSTHSPQNATLPEPAPVSDAAPETKVAEKAAEQRAPESVSDKSVKPAVKPPAAVAVAAPAGKPVIMPSVAAPGPVYAQVLSSTEARAAESLAARLIDSGFTTAYVERLRGGTTMTYRVRVRFSSEDEARAATARLRSITKSEPWITKQ